MHMARDPERIETVLEELEDYWSDNPDLRFGQILSNISQKKGYKDSFYIEDSELIEELQERNRTE